MGACGPGKEGAQGSPGLLLRVWPPGLLGRPCPLPPCSVTAAPGASGGQTRSLPSWPLLCVGHPHLSGLAPLLPGLGWAGPHTGWLSSHLPSRLLPAAPPRGPHPVPGASPKPCRQPLSLLGLSPPWTVGSAWAGRGWVSFSCPLRWHFWMLSVEGRPCPRPGSVQGPCPDVVPGDADSATLSRPHLCSLSSASQLRWCLLTGPLGCCSQSRNGVS